MRPCSGAPYLYRASATCPRSSPRLLRGVPRAPDTARRCASPFYNALNAAKDSILIFGCAWAWPARRSRPRCRVGGLPHVPPQLKALGGRKFCRPSGEGRPRATVKALAAGRYAGSSNSSQRRVRRGSGRRRSMPRPRPPPPSRQLWLLAGVGQVSAPSSTPSSRRVTDKRRIDTRLRPPVCPPSRRRPRAGGAGKGG